MSGNGYSQGVQDKANGKPPADVSKLPYAVRENYNKGYGSKK